MLIEYRIAIIYSIFSNHQLISNQIHHFPLILVFTFYLIFFYLTIYPDFFVPFKQVFVS